MIDFIREMINTNKSSTLREMYYISEGWDLAKFNEQQESDRLAEDLEIVTKCMREDFKLRPEEDGWWRNYRAEELATPDAFTRDPKLVWEWYDMRRGIIHDCAPNPAHEIIAKMERYFDNFQLITQNVDGLHRRAGNTNVIELHGNLWRVRCMEEDKKFEFLEVPLSEIPPHCECGALIRPDVVWFGEAMPAGPTEAAFEVAQNCEVMIVVGTSAVVQPAASIPIIAKQKGATVIEVNLEPTPLTSLTDYSFQGKAGEVLPKLWKFITK